MLNENNESPFIKETIITSPLGDHQIKDEIIEFPKTESNSSLIENNELNPVVSKNLKDAGNKSNDHYKLKLSPFRYKLRSLFLPLIRKETLILTNLQNKLRNPILDFYFAWTANLASHTFYVLMLPLPLWFGYGTVLRDLIHVLGLGIYITGNFKDFMCLPRPRSPPLLRITMSSYTAQEYGWPSSHSANATAVTFILVYNLWLYSNDFTTQNLVLLSSGLFIYYVSLIFGRLYCGMHGFFDIVFGSFIGIFIFSVRIVFGEIWDDWLLNSSRNDSLIGCIITTIIILGGYLFLIHIHFEPVDDCPCFDDSVAFIGVLIGIDFSHWFCYLTNYLINDDWNNSVAIPYNFENIGILKSILRVLLGMISVIIWKSISKPIIFTILPPIYKIVGIYLPRRNFTATAFSNKTTRQIRSQSLSNLNYESIGGEINNMIRDVIDHDKKEEIGPENDIDIYEMLDYENSKKIRSRKERNNLQNNDNQLQQDEKDHDHEIEKEHDHDHEHPPVLSGVFKPRYDVEIIGRLIVYAGISTMSVWGFIFLTELFHLN